MSDFDWNKSHLCPHGTAHPPEFVPIAAGTVVPSGSRIKVPLSVKLLKDAPMYIEKVDDLFKNLEDGLVVARVRYDAETTAAYLAPEGALIELPQPAEGLRHTVVFEELPEDYAENKWGLAPGTGRVRMKCPVCRATFRKGSLEELLSR